MNDKEKWENIEEYNGYYQISNYGNVRSLDRDIKYKDMRIYNYKGNSKALVKTGNGYLCVSLSKESETLVFFVHRLVGKYFVDGYFKGAVINHKDKNPLNNHHSNLEWCTQRWNVQHGAGWNKNKEIEVKKLLEKLYIEQQKTSLEIANLLNVSDRTVIRYLRQLGLEIRKSSYKDKTPIKVFNQKTREFVGSYESQHECARILGVDVRNISAVLKNKRKSCSGYYFEYVGV